MSFQTFSSLTMLETAILVCRHIRYALKIWQEKERDLLFYTKMYQTTNVTRVGSAVKHAQKHTRIFHHVKLKGYQQNSTFRGKGLFDTTNFPTRLSSIYIVSSR